MDKKLYEAIEEQINFELYSSYIYLSMSSHIAQENWKGFTNWFRIQYQEERAHAEVLFDFLIERGLKVNLKTIKEPKHSWDSLETMVEEVLSHEKEVTRRINEIINIAQDCRDHTAYDLLLLFAKEQIEEENSASDILTSVKRIGNDVSALYLFDNQLAGRTFSFPFPSLEK
ncbi:MAG: ferritin [Lachnospirales bacterium]